MARKLKPNGDGPKRGVDGRSKDAPSNTIDKATFLQYAREAEAARGDAAEAATENSEIMKKAEAAGINRRAFKMALALKRLDDAKQADTRADFDTYCDWLGIGAQQEMFDRGETAADPLTEGAVAH